MHPHVIGYSVPFIVGGSASAALVIILMATAAVVRALVWRRKHNLRTSVHLHAQGEDHQMNPLHNQPQTEAHQARDPALNDNLEAIY